MDTTTTHQEKLEGNISSKGGLRPDLGNDNEVCQKVPCKKVALEIVQSFRKNKEERTELKMELEEVETEAGDVEILSRQMEEESERSDNDTTMYEKQKLHGEEKLVIRNQRKEITKRTSLELQSKLVAAENEIANRRNELNDLAKAVKSLMWKGRRISTADREEEKIPDMYIRVMDDFEISKADEIYKTSYYALVSDSTLDSCEHTVTTVESNPTTRTCHHVPGCISVSSRSRTTKRPTTDAIDDTSTIATNQTQCISLDRKAASNVINPKTYRNSVSMIQVKPFPTFTQPNRWGKNPRKLQPIDVLSQGKSSLPILLHDIIRNDKLDSKTRRRPVREKEICFSPLAESKLLADYTDGEDGYYFAGTFSDGILGTYQRTSNERMNSKERKIIQKNTEAWQLLDPIFYQEKARFAWKRNVSIGSLRILDTVEGNKSLGKSDEVSSSHTIISDDTSSISMSSTNRALTGSRAPVGLPDVCVNTISAPNFQWKVGGKKVTYPGRPPSRS